MKEYKAHRYIAAAEKSLEVILTAKAAALHVANHSGEIDDVDYHDLELMPVGYLDSHANFKQLSTGDAFICLQFGLLNDVLAVCSGELRNQITKRLDTHRRETHQMLIGWGVLTVAILFVIWIIMGASDAVAGWATDKVPPGLEVSLGSTYVKSYQSENKITDTSAEAKRVAKIGARLIQKLKNSPYPFHFYVEQSDEVNAYAIPGGYIIVNSKLVEDAKSDDEIAGVVGHEIGHVLRRHSLRSIFHQAGTLVCLDVLFVGHGQKVQNILNQFLKLDELRYSRGQEEQADDMGVRLCFDSGYDPSALIGFFKRLEDKMGGQDNKLMEVLQTHPMPGERIEHIRAEIAALKAGKHN